MNEYPPLAIVTGAAHRLGRQFALGLARRGYAILLHYHSSKEAACATFDEVKALGVPIRIVHADLADVSASESIFTVVDSMPNPLKVLVNSAAIMMKKDLSSTTVDDWDASFHLNLRAPFLLAQQAALRMKDGGLIINISDSGAHKVWTNYPAYIISKAALETLTRLQAKTYAPGIRVNAIAPGLVMPSNDFRGQDWQKLVNRLPLKEQTSPVDILSTLDFLLSNHAITGQTIVVDGGYSLV